MTSTTGGRERGSLCGELVAMHSSGWSSLPPSPSPAPPFRDDIAGCLQSAGGGGTGRRKHRTNSHAAKWGRGGQMERGSWIGASVMHAWREPTPTLTPKRSEDASGGDAMFWCPNARGKQCKGRREGEHTVMSPRGAYTPTLLPSETISGF